MLILVVADGCFIKFIQLKEICNHYTYTEFKYNFSGGKHTHTNRTNTKLRIAKGLVQTNLLM